MKPIALQIEATIPEGARVPIRVLVRSHNPNIVVGKLTLRQITDKEGTLSLRVGADGGIGVEVEAIDGPAKGVRIARVFSLRRDR